MAVVGPAASIIGPKTDWPRDRRLRFRFPQTSLSVGELRVF
jgi:hypothetical protein